MLATLGTTLNFPANLPATCDNPLADSVCVGRASASPTLRLHIRAVSRFVDPQCLVFPLQPRPHSQCYMHITVCTTVACYPLLTRAAAEESQVGSTAFLEYFVGNYGTKHPVLLDCTWQEVFQGPLPVLL